MNHIIEKYKSRFPKDGLIYRIAKSIYMTPRLLFSKYGYVKNYLFFPIKGFLRMHHIRPFYDKNSQKVESLKNRHNGERCFIIATGPSLKKDDIEKLSSEITFGLNSIYRIFPKTQFRPTYYVALDPDLDKYIKENSEVPVEDFAKREVFLNPLMKSRYDCATYIDVCYQNHWFNCFNPRFKYEKNLKSTKDVLFGVYDKYTVTNAAIDLAVYMGFKEIYLLGVDCNYKGSKKYFVDPGKNVLLPDEIQADLIFRSMTAGYEFEEKTSKERNIKIYNATRGGMLNIFERVNFDDVI